MAGGFSEQRGQWAPQRDPELKNSKWGACRGQGPGWGCAFHAGWNSADPPSRLWLEQLWQVWERPSRQLCPQGWAQHSSRLPADAFTEPAPRLHSQVAKQWPSGLASARAAVDGKREWGGPRYSAWTRLPSPGSLLPPGNPGSGLILGVYLGCSGCPPSLGSRPSLSGSKQQAGSLAVWVHGAGGGNKMAAFSPIPGNGLGHCLWSPAL